MDTTTAQINEEFIKEALGNNYIHLVINDLSLQDNMQGKCHARITLSDYSVIEGEGVGQVNAIFNAFKQHYAKKYKSLNTLRLVNFIVSTSKFRNNKDGTAAFCRVIIDIKNSEGKVFSFEDASHSLLASSGRSVAAVVEFFINSEQAYVVLYRALEDARERNRQDLVTRFEHELSCVVKSTSYVKVITDIKEGLLL